MTMRDGARRRDIETFRERRVVARHHRAILRQIERDAGMTLQERLINRFLEADLLAKKRSRFHGGSRAL